MIRCTLRRHQFWFGLTGRYKRWHLRQHVEVPPPVFWRRLKPSPLFGQVYKAGEFSPKPGHAINQPLVGLGQEATLVGGQCVFDLSQ